MENNLVQLPVFLTEKTNPVLTQFFEWIYSVNDAAKYDGYQIRKTIKLAIYPESQLLFNKFELIIIKNVLKIVQNLLKSS